MKAILPSSMGAIRQSLANPEDIPELVTVRCNVDGLADALAVELLDVNKLDFFGDGKVVDQSLMLEETFTPSLLHDKESDDRTA